MKSEQEFLERITKMAESQLKQTKTKGEWDSYVEGATDALYSLCGTRLEETDARSYEYVYDLLEGMGKHLAQEEETVQ